jgi:hypothetical protein
MFMQIIVYLTALFTRSLAAIYCLVFVLGFTLIGRFQVGFVLVTELMPAKH